MLYKGIKSYLRGLVSLCSNSFHAMSNGSEVSHVRCVLMLVMIGFITVPYLCTCTYEMAYWLIQHKLFAVSFTILTINNLHILRGSSYPYEIELINTIHIPCMVYVWYTVVNTGERFWIRLIGFIFYAFIAGFTILAVDYEISAVDCEISASFS